MKESALPDEVRLALMRKLAQNPNLSQRELAAELGISLGKGNYCLKTLAKVCWVKIGNFAQSNNKVGYAYLLTSSGVAEKAALTRRFLSYKKNQYTGCMLRLRVYRRKWLSNLPY